MALALGLALVAEGLALDELPYPWAATRPVTYRKVSVSFMSSEREYE